ncbi:methyltransferase LaeA [Daldinia bambusicola]|nr:methyltransferase LaeA [Daldinia bambusicola]
MAHNGNGSIYPQNGKPEEWWYTENGRSYDTFRRGKYMFPMDEDEMDRMDIFHKFFLVAREENSHYGGLCQRPLPPNPRILDLGCGTGIWVIDMADRHQGRANILGWDLSLIQPLRCDLKMSLWLFFSLICRRIPPGVEFQRRDIEDPWSGVEENSFDLIHMKMLCGGISNWMSLYDRVFRYLKPGTGLFEHVEIDLTPKSADGELPEDSPLRIWALNPHTVGMLQRLGYVDVEQTSKRIPFNSWPDDAQEKEIGRWFNLGITKGLHAITIAPLTRMNGYDPEHVENLISKVRKEMCSRSLRAYCTMYIWTARRPSIPGQRA